MDTCGCLGASSCLTRGGTRGCAAVNMLGRWVSFLSMCTLMTSGARHFAEPWECRDEQHSIYIKQAADNLADVRDMPTTLS